MIAENEHTNFELFKDCLSTVLIEKLAPGIPRRKKVKGRKNEIKPVAQSSRDEEADAAGLSEFVEYIAEETFLALPPELRAISYASVKNDAVLAQTYAVPLDGAVVETVVKPLPLEVTDSLCSYNLIDESSDLERFLEPVLAEYVTATTAPPPEYTPSLTSSRPECCEICQREHLPLTYHHVIPRQMHVKAVKRGWASDWELAKVAWLCRACHSFVHRVATNEELAENFSSVEALVEREDVQKFAQWVGRVRWKAR